MSLAFSLLFLASASFAETLVLSARDALAATRTGDLVLLDIRSPQEWQETGLPEGAWPVSLHAPEFARQMQEILARYEPSRIALICATGGRSAHVAEVLERNGVFGMSDVSEGMFGNGSGKGWLAEGLPVAALEDARRRYEAERAAWERER